MKLKFKSSHKSMRYMLERPKSRLRIAMKVLIAAIMLPIAMVTITAPPVFLAFLKAAVGAWDVSNQSLSIFGYGLGALIITSTIGLFRGSFPHTSAYILGFTAFNIALTQYVVFGAHLPLVSTDAVVLGAGAGNTDNGLVFMLLLMVATTSVGLALVTLRSQIKIVQRSICNI